jgi:heme/copper-type cytochrome/quinol oxidase subunit 2
LLALSGLVFLATVLWAGAQLIFFAQDAKSISKAQAMLTSASIAMIIIMVAGVAVRFVSSSLEVTPSLLQAPGTSSGSRSATPPPATPATPTPTR